MDGAVKSTYIRGLSLIASRDSSGNTKLIVMEFIILPGQTNG